MPTSVLTKIDKVVCVPVRACVCGLMDLLTVTEQTQKKSVWASFQKVQYTFSFPQLNLSWINPRHTFWISEIVQVCLPHSLAVYVFLLLMHFGYLLASCVNTSATQVCLYVYLYRWLTDAETEALGCCQVVLIKKLNIVFKGKCWLKCDRIQLELVLKGKTHGEEEMFS